MFAGAVDAVVIGDPQAGHDGGDLEPQDPPGHRRERTKGVGGPPQTVTGKEPCLVARTALAFTGREPCLVTRTALTFTGRERCLVARTALTFTGREHCLVTRTALSQVGSAVLLLEQL